MPPEPLSVDPTLLSSLGNELIRSAGTIPLAPPPFTTPGTDAISLSIMSQVPGLEAPILAGLPEVKAEASKTAANIVAAAQQYLHTDEQLAAAYERHQFEGAGAPGGAGGSEAGAAGSAAAGWAGVTETVMNAAGGQPNPMNQMGQMMGMPMQMAQQAAQMPMQAMGALGQAPQGIIQGVQSAVQQIGQMTEGAGKDDKDTDADQHPEQQGTAAGDQRAERAPAAEPPTHEAPAVPSAQAVPDSKSPAPSHRADASDPINL
jgi:hypothetical protein